MSQRAGFTLLEVMVALAILTMSLAILVETQSAAALATLDAERYILAADLARMKASEASLYVEVEGFQESDIHENGDFKDLGDDALNVEFGPELEDFKWEYWIVEVDIEMAAELAGTMSELAGSGELSGAAGAAGGAAGGGMGGLMSLLSPEMLTQMIGPYIREVRVRVWWGKDSKTAEKDGTEVVVVTHAINPSGSIMQTTQGAQVTQ